MRIGILTLPLHTNYGGILQAYALQTVLERMGHQVEFLTPPITPKTMPLLHRILSIGKRSCQKYILGHKDITIDRIKEYNRKYIDGSVNTRLFVQKNIHERLLLSLSEVKPSDYDAYIVGSDQIWRQAFNHIWKDQKIDDVYLGFTKGWSVRRIAYAASFGKDEIEIKKETDLEKCRKALARFNAVSTREESGVKICSEFLGYKKARWMPDPTLFLCKEDYEQLISKESLAEDRNQLLSYLLDDNVEKSALRDKIAKELNLKVNITNTVDYIKEGDDMNPQPPVEEWLSAFAKAKYVITDSFHACVFSIHFHRQFTVIANKERGLARFVSLLKMFGLESRIIYSANEYKPLPDIDYAKIEKRLGEIRSKATNFLKENLA